MTIASLFRAAAAAALGFAAVAALASDASPARPITYALVSAIGGDLQVVRSRMQTGTSLGAYERQRIPVPGRALDAAILRGLDRTVARRDPPSQRVFLRLHPTQLDDVPAQDREQVALQRLTEELRALPQRAGWDKIIVVAPHYAIGGGNGMAERIHGVGIYIQGMESGRDPIAAGFSGYDAINPVTGQPNERATERFVAVFLQTRLWVLDARTLAVEQTDTWSFDQKFYDPNATAIDIAKSIPADLLAERLESFVEESSGRALARTVGTVRAGDLQRVEDKAPAKK